MCKPCSLNQHQNCTLGECDCAERREQEGVERRLRAIRTTDERIATLVFTTLLHGGSAEARMLTDGAGREAVQLFVAQVIGTLRTINC